MKPSRTYLELCREVAGEVGVIASDSELASVTGQQGELANIVKWVAEADLQIQNEYLDWKFLWKSDGGNIGIGDDFFVVPNDDLRDPDIDGLVLYPGTSDGYTPSWMEWDEFRRMYEIKGKTENRKPARWTVRPDGRAVLSNTHTSVIPYRLDYYRQPARMTTNTSTSPVPLEFDRLIVVRAKLIYAEREDAPEIAAGSAAEHDDTLDKMIAAYLPGHAKHRRGGNRQVGATWD